MQICNYDLLANLLEELQQRAAELPDMTTLSQMHSALELVSTRLKPYQQSLL